MNKSLKRFLLMTSIMTATALPGKSMTPPQNAENIPEKSLNKAPVNGFLIMGSIFAFATVSSLAFTISKGLSQSFKEHRESIEKNKQKINQKQR